MKRQRSSWHRRLTLGVASLAAAAVGLTGGTVSGSVPTTGDPVDTQALGTGPDYQGTGDAGVAGAAAASGAEDPNSKPDEAPVAPSVDHAPDVAGQAGGAAASDTDRPEAQVGDLSAATGTPDAVQDALDASGTARVIVTMDVPVATEASLSAAAVDDQRNAIGAALDGLAATLAGTGAQLASEFTVTPAAVYTVDQAGFDALLADPAVAAVTLDAEAAPTLDVSTGIIDSDLLNSAGVLGNNWQGSTGGAFEVAVLDTGVDNQHNAFIGRIVSQACYSADADCPGGVTTSTAAGSGDNCTYSTQCDHGTHVGGTAAGALYTGGHEGVARGANIVAIQIGHSSNSCNPGEPNPCWRTYFSDLDLALQRVLTLKNGGRNIAAVNLSIGGGLYTTEALCQAALPNTQTIAANLQAAGVAVVAAAGNDGSNTGVSAPGCLPAMYTIGATDDFDNVAGFSNTNAIVDWFAPGVGIEAPIPTTNNHGPKSGTSMATPHVAGAFALLRECITYTTPGAVATALSNSGVNVTDFGAGITRRRINVLDAATASVNNNDFANAETIPSNTFNDFDWNVCADGEAGEPGPGSIENSIWWNWTPTTDGLATISTEDGGGNVTTFDTVLTVFTGNSLGSLVQHAHDDDGGTGTRSLVRMLVKSGTTYRIRVDGFGGSNGELNLHTQVDPATCFGVNATIVGTELVDVVVGTAGDDVIVLGAGDDTVHSGGGNDRICGDAGNDVIRTGRGDDLVLAGPGSDRLYGERGDDTLVGNAGGGDVNDLGDLIVGGRGNDFIDGWVGDDTLDGGRGNDQLRGEAGTDTVTYASASGGVVADLAAGTATGQGNDTLVAVENLTGSAFNDTLRGDAAANRIRGQGGQDRIAGEGGNDNLHGGPGNDIVLGQTGNDVLQGWSGNDRMGGGQGDDRLRGASGNDYLRGNAGNDVLFGEDGNDRLKGDAGADACHGGAGAGDVAGLTCEVITGVP